MARKLKDSGVDWIGEIPADWKITKLKYLLKKERNSIKVGPFGTQLKGGDFIEEGKWVYNQRTVLDNNFETNDTYISEEKYDELSGFKVEEGDVLITTRGSIGKISRVPINFNDGVIHPCLIKFKIDEKLINYSLLEKIFNESDFVKRQFEFLSNSTTIDVIYSGALKNILIPQIPIEEQGKIANFLGPKITQIDLLISNTIKSISELKKYKQSLITETIVKGLNSNVEMKESGIEWIGKIPIHWKTLKLKNLTTKIIDGTHSTPTYVDEGIPFLRVTDITKSNNSFSEINFEKSAKITLEEHIELSKRCKPEKGDLLVSKNGTIGVPRVVDWDLDFNIFVSLCLIKVNNITDVNYLSYYFKSSLIYMEIAIGGKTGTITNLHLEKIKEFMIPISTIKEQQLIVNFLDEKCAHINSLIEQKQHLLKELEDYKKNMIYEYITGKKEVL